MRKNPESKVQRGVRLLDEKKPGWAAQINTEKLQMEHGQWCILGQLFGDYERGRKALGLDNFTCLRRVRRSSSGYREHAIRVS